MSGALQHDCAVIAAALSEGRREDARLVTGDGREFSTDRSARVVHVPVPLPDPGWTTRTLTCGIALQCAPSKDRVASYSLDRLRLAEAGALAVVEARMAIGWIARRWPGLLPEIERVVGAVESLPWDLDDAGILAEAAQLAGTGSRRVVHPLFGRLPQQSRPATGWHAAMRRAYGRMPWSSPERAKRRIYSIPVGGEGGVQDPNLPPPSRPEDDIEIRADERVGLPYPEWNAWAGTFLPDHVAVLERRLDTRRSTPLPVPRSVSRWFEQHTHHVIRGGLDDGSDLDLDRYVDHFVDRCAGRLTPEPKVFRDLVPDVRDVTTALLLDGSSSLGVHSGRVFELELACADALSQSMQLAGERHGIFVFTGNTRHRVDVRCLKDFDEKQFVAPSTAGLVTGGYTRLGAPIRHLTNRLLAQRSARRLLIVLGDGLMSDEGYEGRYAWADVAHAVDEASEAGVAVYYLGVGTTRIDPLPEVFGPKRSQRIQRVGDLPRALAHVHRELVAA